MGNSECPDYVPPVLRDTVPSRCPNCYMRVWYGSDLFCHEQPACSQFISAMKSIGGVSISVDIKESSRS